MNNLQDTIAKLCLKKYESLKKTGKPCETEWTVLAGIVLKKNDNDFSVVSLATGTKCLGANDLKNTKSYDIGSRLSDSHAEVLARRALLRYLYDQIDLLLSANKSDVFILNSNSQRIEFQSNLSFHFYCSQTPCGDCSIIPKDQVFPPNKIRKVDDFFQSDESGQIVDNKKNKVIYDIHRTGAKCVDADKRQDLKLPGTNYHVIGPLRTKPGRGDPTLSLSCSDKLAKWNIVGIQGALLSMLIPKLRLETIVIGGQCPFSLETMQRGLAQRFSDEIPTPNILQSSIQFVNIKNNERMHPCPSSIIWCSVKNRNTEVAVEGRKQGATKNKKGSHLLITRRELFFQFLKLIEKYPYQNFGNIPFHPKKISYYDYKQWSIDYQKSWAKCKSSIFHAWPSKPDHLQKFSL